MPAKLPAKFYHTLFEKAPIGLALCGLDGALIDVNAAYADILGRTVAETRKLSYWQITPRKYENAEQEQLKMMEQFGRYGPYEKDYLHKDGHLVPVRLSGVVVTIDRKKYIWSQVEDLTEEKYRRVFHEAVPPLGLCDARGRLLAVNKSFADLLGRTVDGTIGVSLWKLSPRQHEKLDKQMQHQLKMEGRFAYGTKWRNRESGPIDVQVSGVRIRLHQRGFVLVYVERVEPIEDAAELLEWKELRPTCRPDFDRPIKE